MFIVFKEKYLQEGKASLLDVNIPIKIEIKDITTRSFMQPVLC